MDVGWYSEMRWVVLRDEVGGTQIWRWSGTQNQTGRCSVQKYVCFLLVPVCVFLGHPAVVTELPWLLTCCSQSQSPTPEACLTARHYGIAVQIVTASSDC